MLGRALEARGRLDVGLEHVSDPAHGSSPAPSGRWMVKPALSKRAGGPGDRLELRIGSRIEARRL